MINAGIVTYNPSISRLRENIDAILPQVGKVIIFDNGSKNIADIEKEFRDTCTIVKASRNIGIASALNRICGICKNDGCDWALTLDQDSVCTENLVDEYSRFTSLPDVGIISPIINDRSMGEIEWNSEEEYDVIDSCITSGSMINLKAWQEAGGFWEELFIDMVDFDICWSLKEKGYRTIRVNSITLLHELGHSKAVLFRGNQVAVLNHTPQRYYYIARNTIAVGRRHHRKMQCLRWNLKRLYLVLAYEQDRHAKLKYMLSGMKDGFLNRLGE